MQPYDTIDDASIEALVRAFYTRVRAHVDLGPVFETALTEEDWPEHIATLCRFWSSVMLASGRYSGNPVRVHYAVAGMRAELFPRWLALFEATARDLFTPELAARFVEKAHRIADSLQTALFFRADAPLPAHLRPRS
jgi:hemoglobin